MISKGYFFWWRKPEWVLEKPGNGEHRGLTGPWGWGRKQH